jgi:hypothetical protein
MMVAVLLSPTILFEQALTILEFRAEVNSPSGRHHRERFRPVLRMFASSHWLAISRLAGQVRDWKVRVASSRDPILELASVRPLTR